MENTFASEKEVVRLEVNHYLRDAFFDEGKLVVNPHRFDYFFSCMESVLPTGWSINRTADGFRLFCNKKEVKDMRVSDILDVIKGM